MTKRDSRLVEADLTELTALVVSGYVSNNTIVAADLPQLIASTYASLAALTGSSRSRGPGRAPAVPIRDSVTHDYLICLDDGHRVRALKRYLMRKYHLSPEEYRARWSLPMDYPMVAPGYSELRSTIARRRGARTHKVARGQATTPSGHP